MMKARFPAALTLLTAGLLAVGGCPKKKPSAPASPPEVVVTVTVRGEVDAEGKFKQGGYNVAKDHVDGADANALAAALGAKKAEIATTGSRMVVRVLVYSSAPYGVVRRIVSAAAKAEVAALSLATVEDRSVRPGGVRFAPEPAGASSGEPVRLRIWPGPYGVQPVYQVGGSAEAVLGTRALRAALASQKGAGGVVLQPTDKLSAGLVAEAVSVVRGAGPAHVYVASEPLLGEAPKVRMPTTAAAATQPVGPVLMGPKPPSSFSGASGDAYHVVYLIDRSGSMVATFDMVRTELARSIKQLDPKQDFHVIFFGGRRPVESPEKKLLDANDTHKAATVKFLEGIPSSGVTQPIPAIRRAFSVLRKADKRRPGKLVYMLTDGDFSGEMRFTDNQAVLKAFRTLNANKDVVIHTLLFGKQSEAGEEILKIIAAENGGKYRFIQAE